jgi:hypothetical protein
MIFAKKIAIIPTTIILSFLYYVVIGIIALINFIVGKDLLDKKLKTSPSFWRDKELIPTDFERCKRQF